MAGGWFNQNTVFSSFFTCLSCSRQGELPSERNAALYNKKIKHVSIIASRPPL